MLVNMKSLKFIMALGFSLECFFFILTGFIFAMGEKFLAIFFLLVALIFAYITGKLIEINAIIGLGERMLNVKD